MTRLALAGLAKIELPGHTVLLSEGAVLTWAGDTYLPLDPLLGTIAAIEVPEEGVGNQVPAASVTFLPHPDSTPADLAQPGWQRARARFWVAEYVPATGAVTGTPTMLFDGFLDQTTLRVGRDLRELEVSVVSWLELLFALNRGNGLGGTFHKTVWAGETGHDQATGLSLPVAWGTDAPPQAARGVTVLPGFAAGASDYRTLAWSGL